MTKKTNVYVEYQSTKGEGRFWDVTLTSERELTDREITDHLRETAEKDTGHGIRAFYKFERRDAGERNFG